MLAMMLKSPIKWNIYKCWSLTKKHFPTDCFLIEISLNRILLGAQKGYPPWVVPSPQIKTHTPRLENLHPSIQFFFFLLGCLCNCFLLGRLHLHVLYFQPVWFQRFLVAWLIMLIWSDLLSLQELCFHWVQAALLPTRLVPEVPCGLAHHVDMKWLAFTSRSVLPLGTSLDYCQPD